MKKFIYCTISITAVIFIMCMTLCFIKPTLNFTYDDPAGIKVYALSSSHLNINGTPDSDGVNRGFTETNAKITYRELKTKTAQMFNQSMFTHAIHGNNIKPVVEQDLDGKYAVWTSSFYTKTYVIEFIFSTKQSQVISYKGDTKVVEYYGFTMLLTLSKGYQEIPVYFTKEKDSTTRESSPMIVYGNTSKLVKYINEIKNK